jgi:hypothetical protein
MKWGFGLLMLLPLFCGAQEIILLDRHFKEPIQFTRSFTREALNSNFPVYRADIDAIIHITETLLAAIRSGNKPEQGARILQAGHSRLTILGRSSGIYSTQLVVLTSRSGNKGATLELLTEKDGTKKAAQKLLVFLDYLKNNRSIWAPERLP